MFLQQKGEAPEFPDLTIKVLRKAPVSSHTDPRYKLSEVDLAKVRAERKFVPNDPPDLFPTVRKWSFTPTADFVCVRIRNGVPEVLLTQRTEKPWCGEWFVPGGKIAPGVHPAAGCQTNCKRELGFTPDQSAIHFIDWYPLLNPEDQHGGESYFTLMTIFVVEVTEEQAKAIVLDGTASEKRWFSAVSDELPTAVQEILRMSGVFA